MKIEYEATFTNINKDEMRSRLEKAGAKLSRAEFMQKRMVFKLPEGHEINGGWIRVRDEGDRITMSLKKVLPGKIEDQEEICLEVNDFNEAVEFLKNIGCRQKAFQESRRELWILAGAEITIDEWPFLEPFVEVESDSEEEVKSASEKIGLDYGLAKFCAIDILYKEKYGVSEDEINNHTPEILFNGKNPFDK